MGKRKSRRRISASSDDIITLNDDGALDDEQGDEATGRYEWLSTEIENAAKQNKSKKSAKTYDGKDMCILGLERILEVTNSEDFENLPLAAIESQTALANMYQKRAHEQMVDAPPSKLTAKNIVQLTSKVEIVDNLYAVLSSRLEKRRRELLLEQTPIVHNSTVVQPDAASDVRVKKVEIPKFSGISEEWPQFKSTFEDCFHNKSNMSASAKFYHLIPHLEKDSEAYATVSGLLNLGRPDEHYESAWKALCETYDNERKIVNNIVLSFIDMQSIETPSRAALIGLINKTNNMMQSLPKYGIGVKHWDPIVVPLLVRKMDGESIRLWSLERDQKKIAELKPLLEFIRNRAEGMDTDFVVNFGKMNHTYSSNFANSSNQSTVVSNRGHFSGSSGASVKAAASAATSGSYKHDPSFVKRKPICYHCNGPHQLYDCHSFGRMSLELQEERLKTLGNCTICLRKGHTSDSCKMSKCKQCGGPHNTKLLCPLNRKSAQILSVLRKTPVVNINGALIATLRVNASDEHGNSVTVRAMSDGGAHMCMVSTRLVQRLKLDQRKLTVPLEGAGRYEVPSKAVVDIKLSPADNGSSQGEWISAGVLKSISSKLPLQKFDIGEWTHLQGLPLADTSFNIPEDVDILLSVEFMARIQCDGMRKNEQNSDVPIACKITFGWVVYGSLPSLQQFASVSHLALADSQRISDSLEKLWQVEAIKERPLFTPEEVLCQKMFSDTITHADDGRYTVAMPIKPNPPKLGSSLKAAIARQLQNEARFRKDPKLKINYVKDVQQFLDLDHMELVPFDEIGKEDGEVYYIPHHAARSNEFRVVFDGSVKTTTGISLNDILLNGPRVQEDLTVIIMRFRTYRVALTTDITKMYRQIRVPVHQRDLQRIVWRENEFEPIRHYRLKTQTYGLKSSAYCCIETLRHCALEYQREFPLASKAVLESFYADDGTLGADNDSDAEQLYRQLTLMLEKGGFPLAKWASNSKYMQSLIGATAKSINLELFNENSVLGIKWMVQEDCFCYDFGVEISNQSPTKRFVIASVARLYDPVGWIAPVIILGKMLIQDIWRSKCDWDAIVSIDIQKKWHEFRVTLSDLSKVAIPRWLGMINGSSVQIHGFSDASKKAYGVAFYARVESVDGIRCNLVVSKTRVAPLKGMTIPRMELCGAVMMAQMCEQICSIHNVRKENLTLWTDSSIVIHWLSKCPAGMKTFVGNRVAEAQECSKGARWKHVRTHDNPADIASRGVNASEIVDNALWFNGPTVFNHV